MRVFVLLLPLAGFISVCAPYRAEVRIFSRWTGGPLNPEMSSYRLEQAEGSIELLGERERLLDVRLYLSLTMRLSSARSSDPHRYKRIVRGAFTFKPSFIRPGPEEAQRMIEELRAAHRQAGVVYDEWGRKCMRESGVTETDVQEALMAGRVLEDHPWGEPPRCLVRGRSADGRLLLIWCDYPPAQPLRIHNAFDLTQDHPVFAEYWQGD